MGFPFWRFAYLGRSYYSVQKVYRRSDVEIGSIRNLAPAGKPWNFLEDPNDLCVFETFVKSDRVSKRFLHNFRFWHELEIFMQMLSK